MHVSSAVIWQCHCGTKRICSEFQPFILCSCSALLIRFKSATWKWYGIKVWFYFYIETDLGLWLAEEI